MVDQRTSHLGEVLIRLIKILVFCSLLIHSELAIDEAPKSIISVSELNCLAEMMFYEARGESTNGIIAVGQVALNRSRSGRFPSTICGVVKQPGQYSYVASGNIKKKPEYYKIFLLAMVLLLEQPKDRTNGALFFHNLDVEHVGGPIKATIGNHIFY